jgi:Cof subfamily protein (haloacid dehalogenase superfamily)
MKYKIMASDLDGTLLKNDMTLSRENQAAIKLFSDMGGTFVVTSGRTYYEIPECVRENPDIRYITYSNGTAVYDKERGCDIISNRIPNETVNRVLDILADYSVYFSVYYNGISYIDAERLSDGIFEQHQVNSYYKELLLKSDRVTDYIGFCREAEALEAVVIFFSDDEDLEECKSRLKCCTGITVTSSIGHNLELCSEKAGKGETLTKLAEMLGVSKEEIIAIGDNSNDMTLLRAAGLAVAVENANEELKGVADVVCGTNEEHAAAYVVNKVLNLKRDRLAFVKEHKKPVIIAASICAAIIAALVLIFTLGGVNSSVRIGYVGNQTYDSWSGKYAYLDGKCRTLYIRTVMQFT